jgi:DNA-binding NarL/FixJ family response regulator
MKVLLIDDHPLILAALQTVIERLSDDVEVTGAAGAEQAREALCRHSDFDLVLLDLHMGAVSGFDLLAEFREAYPALPVVVVSASDRSSDVIRCIDMGAMGFVPKRASNEQLLEALTLVLSGGIYVPSMTLGTEGGEAAAPQAAEADTVPGYLHVVGDEAQRAGGYAAPASLAALNLTPRQKDVLALLLQGLPNKMIARRMGLSAETIKDHVAGVLRVLGVNSRTQAVLAVSQMTHRTGEFSALRPLPK